MRINNAIRQNRKKLCESETVVISPDCRERFLPLDEPGFRILTDCGVMFAGVAHLRPPYAIHRFLPHCHTLVYTLSGEGTLLTEGQRHSLCSHTLWIGPANIEHFYEIKKAPWSIAWLCLIPENKLRFSPAHAKVFNTHSPCEIDHAFRQAIDECDTRSVHYSAMVEAYAHLILQLLKRDLNVNPLQPLDSRQIKFDQLMREVRNNPAKKWTCDELRKTAQLPVANDRFRQLCQTYTGTSPRELLVSIRLKIASELLLETDYCIYTIAAMVGYENEYAFSTAFRRVIGVSPREYRYQTQQHAEF